MEKEYLNWFGNALNFIIVIYLTTIAFNTECFSMSSSLIAIFGLTVSVFIQLRNNLIKGEVK